MTRTIAALAIVGISLVGGSASAQDPAAAPGTRTQPCRPGDAAQSGSMGNDPSFDDDGGGLRGTFDLNPFLRVEGERDSTIARTSDLHGDLSSLKAAAADSAGCPKTGPSASGVRASQRTHDEGACGKLCKTLMWFGKGVAGTFRRSQR